MIILLITTTRTPVRIIGAEKRRNLKSETSYQLLDPNGLYMLINKRAKAAVKITSLTMFPLLTI